MYNTDMPNRADLPTTRQLIRSTLIAIAAAAALLVTVILPAEYAIDPTGIGKVLGLTEMGEIKQQLAKEAEADEATTATLEETQEAATVSDSVPAIVAETEVAPVEPTPAAPVWQDEVSVTLAPGEAAEIKLTMKDGETATYEWRVDQGHLNSDLHADGTAGEFTSYRKGRAEEGNAGDLTAAFDGAHGWFWRNRSDVSSTVTLKTKGAYSEVKRVL